MTARPATLHAYFGYRDAPAALRWLETAFGFETAYEVPGDDGGIVHSEVRFGDVAMMVFTDIEGYDRPSLKRESVGHGMFISVDSDPDVDAVFERASAAGATVVWSPAATEWGNYRCRVLDPEGFEWTFGTLRPGQDSGPWSTDADADADDWT